MVVVVWRVAVIQQDKPILVAGKPSKLQEQVEYKWSDLLVKSKESKSITHRTKKYFYQYKMYVVFIEQLISKSFITLLT